MANKLYAVAAERWDRRKRRWVPDIQYIHATDEVNARFQFRGAYPDPRVARIVAVGLAVGYFAESEDSKTMKA